MLLEQCATRMLEDPPFRLDDVSAKQDSRHEDEVDGNTEELHERLKHGDERHQLPSGIVMWSDG